MPLMLINVPISRYPASLHDKHDRYPLAPSTKKVCVCVRVYVRVCVYMRCNVILH